MTDATTTYRARLTTMCSAGYRPMVKLTLREPLRCGCGLEAYVVQRPSHADVTVCRACWVTAAASSSRPQSAGMRR